MAFEKIHLGDIATLKNGYTYKSKDFVENGIPVVKIKNIQPPFIDINDCNYVSEDIYELTKEYSLRYGDILISMTGSGVNQMSSAVGKVGRVQFNDKALQNQRVGKIEIIDKTKYDSDFLFYYISQKKLLEYFVINSTGSANQANISKKIIENTPIPNISLYKQKKIGYILRLLDKKIKINNKIIENLEVQAQAIFKSWFVDFEPFQDGNFVESELGLIPEGWEVGKLGKSKLGNIIGSGIDEFFGEKIYLATADVSDTNINNISTKVTFEDRPSRANMQPKPLSVWFAKMKNSRKLIFVDSTDNEIISRMIFSTGFAGIQANEDSFTYLWAYLLSDDFDKIKNAYAMGTTMQAINNKNINNILIAIPTDSILKEFSTITKPMIEIISNLRNQNEKLAQTRDTLLPKLMSGEIDVSNIKIDDEDIDYE